MPRQLRQRLYLIPCTCLLILFFNFVLSRQVEVPSFQMLKTSFYQTGLQEQNYVITESIKPLLVNKWPFASLNTVQKLYESRDAKLEAYAKYIWPQLSALYQQTQDPYLFELISKTTSSMSGSQKTWKLFQKCRIFCLETQLASYLSKLLRFDFGSLQSDPQQKVVSYTLGRLKNSMQFLALPLVFTFLSAHFLGLVMALYTNTIIGKIMSGLCALMYAVPLYIMIPLMIEKIALTQKLPVHGPSYTQWVHYLLPTVALMYGGVAIYSRLNKALFERLFQKDYLLTAKANGVSKWRQIFIHVTREACLTSVPLFLGAFNFFFSALILIETLFELDGLGRFFYLSLLQQDMNATLLCILWVSLISMLGYWLGDVFLYYFDPRIRHHGDQRVF